MSTTIEWTDETWNPVTGCEKISPGCKHCYAKALHDMRHQAFLNGRKMPEQYHVPFERVQCWPNRLDIPLRWRGPRMCFVNSMSDLFHEDVPLRFVAKVFGAMALAQRHTFQVLTKRPERMLKFIGAMDNSRMCIANLFEEIGASPTCDAGYGWPLPNVWPGVSVESKKYLYRLDHLRQIPAPVRMVSFEPLLEDLGEVNLQGIGWAIVGGESGRGARPMHPDWARSLRDQCIAQGVPFFFKQWGEWEMHLKPAIRGQHNGGGIFLRPNGDWGQQDDWWSGEAAAMNRVGKKDAGRRFDGREWNEFPKPYPGHQVVRLQRRIAA